LKIAEIIKQSECRKFEFKEKLPAKADLYKTVIAFANDAGGEIFIGIKDNPRKVVGVSEESITKVEEQISSIIHDNCSPIILPDIFSVNYQGKHIVIVRIYKGSNSPYFIKSKGKEKGTYIRVGSTNRLASKEIIEELERQKQNISFDSLPVYSKKVEELDIAVFRKHFEEETGEKFTKAVMRKMELISKEQNKEFPTNALVLLSSDEIRKKLFPYAKIECARFKGTVPGDFIDQKSIENPLSLQAEEAYKFVLRNISKGSTYEGVYRKDRWEYPIIAIREVIRNAVIHRDYSLKGKDIKIAIFDDKIEITSPGKLMPTIDYNDMESGQSDIRNKILAPVFKKLGIIEQWGNGLRLIAKELEKYPEIKMEWSEPEFAFRITFVKVNYGQEKEKGKSVVASNYKGLRTITDDYGRLRTIMDNYKELETEEKQILIYLLDNEKVKRKEAVKLLNLGKSKTYDVLDSLVKKGLILRKGRGRGTYYILKGE